MELIIDSADVAQIKVLKELCTVAGVTTNPTILTKTGREATDGQSRIFIDVLR